MERDLGRSGYLGVHCALMNSTKEKKKKRHQRSGSQLRQIRVDCVFSIYRPPEDVIDSAHW